MSRPNLSQMLLARAQFDGEINRALTLIAPNPDGSAVHLNGDELRMVRERVTRARKALDRFEDALNA